MRNRLALLTMLTLALIGCGSPDKTALTKPINLAKGTGIKLMLLQQLESGVTKEGDQANLMVAEDVTGPDGTVVIPKGSLAKGVVSWSRRADTMSSLTNRPARLAIKLVSVQAGNGADVRIEATGQEDGAYQFTRDNTGHTELSTKIEQLWQTEEGQKILTDVQNIMEKGESLDSAENAETLKKAIEKLELPKATELLKSGKIGEVQGLMDKLKRGEGLAELAATNLTGLGAVMELANMAQDVGGRLEKMIKGKNIKAYVGTPVEVVVSESVTLQPK